MWRWWRPWTSLVLPSPRSPGRMQRRARSLVSLAGLNGSVPRSPTQEHWGWASPCPLLALVCQGPLMTESFCCNGQKFWTYVADLSKQCNETDGFKPEGVLINHQSPLERKQGEKNKTKRGALGHVEVQG